MRRTRPGFGLDSAVGATSGLTLPTDPRLDGHAIAAAADRTVSLTGQSDRSHGLAEMSQFVDQYGHGPSEPSMLCGTPSAPSSTASRQRNVPTVSGTKVISSHRENALTSPLGGGTRVVSRAGGGCKSRVRSFCPQFYHGGSRRTTKRHEAPRRFAALAPRDLTDGNFGLAIAVDWHCGGLAQQSGVVGRIRCLVRWRHCVGGGGFSVVLHCPRAVSVHKKFLA